MAFAPVVSVVPRRRGLPLKTSRESTGTRYRTHWSRRARACATSQDPAAKPETGDAETEHESALQSMPTLYDGWFPPSFELADQMRASIRAALDDGIYKMEVKWPCVRKLISPPRARPLNYSLHTRRDIRPRSAAAETWKILQANETAPFSSNISVIGTPLGHASSRSEPGRD